MAIDGFLELTRDDGGKVEGESLDHKFAKTIAIDSFEMKTEDADQKSKPAKEGKEEKEERSSRRSKGKAKHPISFKITKAVDSSSPSLYLSYCLHSDQEDANDKPFQLARVTLRKSDSSRALAYLVIDFADAFVTSYSVETDSEKLPNESVKFTCRKCCVSYRAQKQDGGGRDTMGGWDFLTGAKWEASRSG